MGIDGGRCTCPQPWPYTLDHVEADGSPVVSVAHHPQQCRLPSLRLNGYRLPPEEFALLIAQATGSREGAKP